VRANNPFSNIVSVKKEDLEKVNKKLEECHKEISKLAESH